MAAAASLSGPGLRALGHRARCGHLCPVARSRWAPRPGSWLRPAPGEARAAPARGERARARGGPGTRALTGRGPRAQSPCPSRWRGEETRGAGKRQSRRRRLRLLPPLPLVRPGRTGGGQGASPADWDRSAPRASPSPSGPGDAAPELRGSAGCATRRPPPRARRVRGPALRRAAQPREAAGRTPARRWPPAAGLWCPPGAGCSGLPWRRGARPRALLPGGADGARPGRPRASPVRSAARLAPSSGWRGASPPPAEGPKRGSGKAGPSPTAVGLVTAGLR